jgi:hypothetical protein
MADREKLFPQFWINERDHHGRSLDPKVIEAARVSWERILRCARAKLRDPDEGPQIVERMALIVSRALRRTEHRPIQDLAAYFTWACVRQINRIAARESREQSGHAVEHLERISARDAGSWFDSILEELQLEQLLYYLDNSTRKMFAMRCEGYSWDQIALRLGYANGHSAEVQYGKGLAAARRRLSRRGRHQKPKASGESD